MAVHWVNYDLNQTGQAYTRLVEYLKSHDSWATPLKSSFFVKTSLTAAQLRDRVMQQVDANDGVVVVTVTGASWATCGISSDVNEWLKKSL